MHWTQVAYIAVLILAFATGRPSLWLAAVMMANLGATIALASTPLSVSAADIACAALLIDTGRRGQFVALVFVSMLPVYICGDAFAWQNSTTYAIIDTMALLQILAIGGVDRGIYWMGRKSHNIFGAVLRWDAVSLASTSARVHINGDRDHPANCKKVKYGRSE